MYRLVTGFYPSRNTADKILQKVKATVKHARVERYEDCFIVLLYECSDYEEIDDMFSFCMKNKIYCGIMQEQKEKDNPKPR